MSQFEIDPANLPRVASGNHGRTLAAWITNGLIVLGVLIGAIGVMIPHMAVLWTGAGVVVAALLIGAALRALGHGQPLK